MLIDVISIFQIMDDQTFQVLGQQSLTELRDKIPCVHDFSVPGDFSESPDTPQDVLPKVSEFIASAATYGRGDKLFRVW